MAAGQALTDSDRQPWLRKVAEWIGQHTDAGSPGVITCSALKKSYRNVLRGERVIFVYLAGTRDEIALRLAARHGHFMPASLLASQFATLEPPTPDEGALTLPISMTASELVEEIVLRLQLAPAEKNGTG